ncbi:hypothetical protein Tco_0720910 [Tanacetum coccineum]
MPSGDTCSTLWRLWNICPQASFTCNNLSFFSRLSNIHPKPKSKSGKSSSESKLLKERNTEEGTVTGLALFHIFKKVVGCGERKLVPYDGARKPFPINENGQNKPLLGNGILTVLIYKTLLKFENYFSTTLWASCSDIDDESGRLRSIGKALTQASAKFAKNVENKERHFLYDGTKSLMYQGILFFAYN